MAKDGLARIDLTSTTSVSNNLALCGLAEWENSGVALLKALLYQFQTSVQLPMYHGVDGTGVDVTFYGDTAGVNMLWDYSEDKFDVTNAKMDWYRDTTTADPGRMISWGDTHAGTLTASPTTFQCSATFNGAANAAGGVTGAEIKARHTTGNVKSIGQLRGLVGNADTKNGTTGVAYAVEGSVDVGAGGTITTSACFHGNLNNSGTVTTSHGVYLEGVNGYNLTYGVYVRYATTGVYIASGSTIAVDAQGKGRFGIPDWGVGSTGVTLDGTDPDSVLQAGAQIVATLAAASCYSATYSQMAVTKTQNIDVSAYGSWNELYVTGGTIVLTGSGNYAGCWGHLEISGTVTTPTDGHMSGLMGSVITPATFTNEGIIAGCYVDSKITTGLTNNGTTAHFAGVAIPGEGINPEFGIYFNGCDAVIGVASGTAYEDGVKVADGEAGDEGVSGKVGFDALAKFYVGDVVYYIALFDADSVTGE